MGDVRGERCQIFTLRGAVIIALKEPNDLIEKCDVPDMGKSFARLFAMYDVDVFQKIDVKPEDIEIAYKLSRSRAYKEKSTSPKKYPPITISGKGFDAEIVYDTLRILGTKNLVWKQDIALNHADTIETDLGMAIILPWRIKEDTLTEGHPLNPIEVKVED